MRRKTALCAIATTVIGPIIWTAPIATAEPVGPDPVPPTPAVVDAPPGNGPTYSLADLGAPSTVAFYVNRDVTSSSLTFPVPAGLNPVALRARIELPVNLRFGSVAVSQGGRTINRQPLPPQDMAEMVIPLNGVEISGGWVNLNFTVSALPLEDYCWDPIAPIRLVDGAVSFSGTDRPPTTVADFLPPVLRKVTIGVPAKPSQAESTAAVQVAAAVARRNGQQPEVVVVPLPAGAPTLPPAGPLERQFIVKEGPTKGLSLQGPPESPALLVSGPANELADQVRLLSDDALRYAVSPTTVADALPEPALESDSTTIGQLTGGGLSSEATWPTVGVEIDQTRWGHPLGGVTVHLIGSYTPLPTEFGGEVVASVGGQVVDRWPSEGAGTIDRTVTIPDRLLKRFTSLEVQVRTTGHVGHCGDYLPLLLKLDGATAVTVQRANPPAPQGFQSLPQALMPRVQIGFGSDPFWDTVRAAQIIVGLQRSSGVPLQVDVVPLDQAIGSVDPAVLIAADGWKDKPIALPFTADGGQVNVTGVNAKGESTTLGLDPAKGFGSLQTVFDGQRTVLIATSTGGPGQLDDLLRYLSAQPGRWAGLDGRAILSAPGAEPITVPSPPVDYTSTPQGSPDSTQESDRWFWWGVGGVATLAAVGAVGILLRARRQSPPDSVTG